MPVIRKEMWSRSPLDIAEDPGVVRVSLNIGGGFVSRGIYIIFCRKDSLDRENQDKRDWKSIEGCHNSAREGSQRIPTPLAVLRADSDVVTENGPFSQIPGYR